MCRPLPQTKFRDEEGTGLGPSLEFYALVSAEFQRRDLAMWVCDDNVPDDNAREVSFRVLLNIHGILVVSVSVTCTSDVRIHSSY